MTQRVATVTNYRLSRWMSLSPYWRQGEGDGLNLMRNKSGKFEAELVNANINIIGVNRPATVRDVREIPHFWLFPAFLRERPAFLALFRSKKNAENRNNFSCTDTFFFENSSKETSMIALPSY